MIARLLHLAPLFASRGPNGAVDAPPYGGLLVVLALLAGVVLGLRATRDGASPWRPALNAVLPFLVLALGCLAFVIACRRGADPRSTWYAVIAGVPLTGLALGLLTRSRPAGPDEAR